MRIVHRVVVIVLAGLGVLTGPRTVCAQVGSGAGDTFLFSDDFEDGAARWAFPVGTDHEIVDRGVPRGRILSLRTGSHPSYAIIPGSERWDNVRIEGAVLFPDSSHSYLGFIYRYSDDSGRIDFGSVYIKGNGSYAQANPHHDMNVGRSLYPELRVPLRGQRAVEVGRWQRFALEVVGPRVHLYVGDLESPALTLPSFGFARGAFGFKPRNPGAAVWIDDVVVRSIDGFTYQGPLVPDIGYDAHGLVTEWEVFGPVTSFVRRVEEEPYSADTPGGGEPVGWSPAPVDDRGAVLTGRVVEYRGAGRVAYFRTTIQSDRPGPAVLELSTVDDLAIWLDGEFIGFAPRQSAAWWDAGANTEHPPILARVQLREGRQELLVRVVGGVYASGGFFVRLRPGT